MHRALSIALMIMCLLYTPASLFAQNSLINLNYQDNLLLKVQSDFGKLQTLPLTPAGLISRTTIIEYEKSILPLDGPIYSLIKNKDLIYEYWENLEARPDKTSQTAIRRPKNIAVDRKIFHKLYNQPKIDEKKLIRLAWKKVFGIDVWYPYYKAKEIEDWVKERVSVKICGFKGKPSIEKNHIIYVFKKTF